MKRLNIKKLSAAATAGAIALSTLAPIAMADLPEKADLYSSTTGAPSVMIAVGSLADVSDVINAGKLATKIAQGAVIEKAVAVDTVLSTDSNASDGTPTTADVNVTVGGTTTVSSDYSKTYDSYYLYSGASANKLLDSNTLGQAQLPFLKNKTYSYKYDGSSGFQQTIKEEINLTFDATFETLSSVEDLVGYIKSANQWDYNATASIGWPMRESAGSASAYQDDGSEDNIPFVWFGKDYTVFSASDLGTRTEIQIVDSSKIERYNKGNSFEVDGTGAYADKVLTLEFTGASTTSNTGTYSGSFTLKNEDGTVLVSKTVDTGAFLDEEVLVDDAQVIKDRVYVQDVRFNQDDAQSYTEILAGASVVKLVDGLKYPYDPNDNITTDDAWTVLIDENTSAITSPNVPSIKSVLVRNNAKIWGSSDPIYSDDSVTTGKTDRVKFLTGTTADPVPEDTAGYGFVEVYNRGFRDDSTSTTSIEIGNGSVKYTDTSGAAHDVLFFISKDLSSITGTSGLSFILDGQTFYVRANTTDINFTIGTDNNTFNGLPIDFNAPEPTDNNVVTAFGATADFDNNWGIETQIVDINGINVTCSRTSMLNAGLNCLADGNFQVAYQDFGTITDNSVYIGTNNVNRSWYYNDNNLASVGIPVVPLTGPLMTQTFNYVFHANESTNSNSLDKLYLLLDGAQTMPSAQYSGDVLFNGADVGEDGTNDYTFYVVDNSDFLANNTAGDATYIINDFNVDYNGGSQTNMRVFIEARGEDESDAHDIVANLPNTNLTYPSVSAEYQEGSDTTPDLTHGTTSTFMQKAWYDYGSFADVSDGEAFKLTLPQTRRYVDMQVLGKGATTTTSGGASGSIASGGTATIGGVEITVNSVTTGGSSGGTNLDDVIATADPAVVTTVVPVGNLIVTDKDATSTSATYIIVGGYLVNELAKTKTRNVTLSDGSYLEDKVTASGDYVADTLSNGDIILAGFTKGDTGDAVQEFINTVFG